MKSKINIIVGNKEEYRTTKDWPYHVSAGGVIYQIENQETEILLLYRSAKFNSETNREAKDTWHLPKGTLHYGETIEDCAIREIREEASVEVEIQAYLGSRIADWQSESCHKIKNAHYFLMKYLGESDGAMDDEHESKGWFPLHKAKDLLPFEMEMIDRAKEALDKIVNR